MDEHVAYQELVSRRWRAGEPVDVFVADLKHLASLASLEERTVRLAFMNGLPAGAAMQVKATPGVKALSLAQVVELARTLMAASDVAEREGLSQWTGWTEGARAKVTAVVGTAPKPSAKIGGEPAGLGAANAPRGQRRRCFGCSEEGHFVRDCPYDNAR